MTWDESQHPRDDHGRFGEGGGGAKHEARQASARAVESTRSARESGSTKDHARAAEHHLKAAEAHRKTFKDTEEEHKRDGTWAKERVALHDKYTEAVTKGLPTSSTPTVHMTGGGPASGKTTGLLENKRTGIPSSERAAHIDPDGAKKHIPEYNERVAAKDKTAAAFVHEESSHMAKNSVGSALESGHDVVYDSVGDSGIKKLTGKVEQMRAQGAKRIVAHYATVDVDEAIARSDKRAERTGRYVPHEYIRQAHKDVSQTAQAAIKSGLFDKIDVWDTSGKDPVHVATHERGGELKIHDQAAWDKFKKRGE